MRERSDHLIAMRRYMTRKARIVWRWVGRVGNGNLSTDSGVLVETPYSFRTRFEHEKSTNPEELIAAAHAGCFTLAPAFGCSPLAAYKEALNGSNASARSSRFQIGPARRHRLEAVCGVPT